MLRLRFYNILLRIFASLIIEFHGNEVFTSGLFASYTFLIIITLFVLLVVFCNSQLSWIFYIIILEFDQKKILAISDKDFAYRPQNQNI